MKRLSEPVIESSGNVFVDLGFPPDEAAIPQMRAALMSDLRERLGATVMTVEQAAAALQVTSARVSHLVAGRWEKAQPGIPHIARDTTVQTGEPSIRLNLGFSGHMHVHPTVAHWAAPTRRRVG
ncbi:MAG: hypothetical protein NT029_11730 [Armatimonadetes bacterium]|nr:hypothetical protein [Armatimonadota bacterium]